MRIDPEVFNIVSSFVKPFIRNAALNEAAKIVAAVAHPKHKESDLAYNQRIVNAILTAKTEEE